jgi:hypothetical protein
MWQAVNPTSWFNDTPNDLKAPLKPFKFTLEGKEDDQYWTSKQVYKTDDFGYTYPNIVTGANGPATTKQNFLDLEAWSLTASVQAPAKRTPLDLSTALVFRNHPDYVRPVPPKQPIGKPMMRMAKQAAQKVVEIGTEAVEKVSAKADEAGDERPVAPEPVVSHNAPNERSTPPEPVFSHSVVSEQAELASTATAQAPADEAAMTEWYIDSEVERMAVNGPFGIYFFIGPAGGAIDANPNQYMLAPTLAGFSYTFVATKETCDNCAQQAEERVKITSTTNLTPILKDYVKIGELKSLLAEDVEPFLVDRLRWRVLTVSSSYSAGEFRMYDKANMTQIECEKRDPRHLANNHGLRLLVNSAVPMSGDDAGRLHLENYPDVVGQIISDASSQTTRASLNGY